MIRLPERRNPEEKPLHWTGSAKKDLLKFPREVIRDFGFALGVVQLGFQPPSAKHWKGLGSGIYELIEETGEAFRVVYSVRFDSAVYVLHCFQKKAKSGVATPKKDVELIKQRLKEAREDHEELYGKSRHNS